MPRNHCQMAIKKRIMTAKVIGYMKPDIDPNTRLYVPFSEGVGDLAKDYSQYCNHAQLTDVEWSPDGFNGAGKFNGSSSFGDCGNDASLDSTDALSIEVWAKTTTSHFAFIVNKYSADGYSLFVYNSPNSLRGGIDDGVNAQRPEYSVNLFDGNWHQLGLTAVPGGMVYLYYDGKGVASGDASAVGDISNDKIVEIGSRAEGTVEFFNGTIDNVIMFSAVKNPAQIAADCYEVVCN